ncbi:WD40 repeat domain-containing protein [Oceanisphaera sp. KMM 10153]|uniref:WD40 repeat domain-containing protein n=1 Tax=Oceanisphaera submarina TaxID=3390193 RepID=UPI0039768179
MENEMLINPDLYYRFKLPMRKPKLIKMPTSLLMVTLCVTFLLISGCDAGNVAVSQSRYAKGTILAAQTSADGRFTLVATGPSPVQVWQRGQELPLYHWHQGESTDDILLLTISPDGHSAATASINTVAVWSLQNGRNLGFYQLKHSLRALALANDGNSLLLGYHTGEVEYVDLQSGRRLLFMGHRLEGGNSRINSVDLSANGRYALSASQNGQVLLWQTTDAAILSQWQHENSVSLVRLDAKGRLAFSADAQGQGELHHLPSGELYSRLQVPFRGQTFVSARLDSASNRLLTGSTSRRLELWQLDDGKQLQQWEVGLHTRLRPASAMVYDVTFIDQQHVYSVSSAGLGETWALHSREQNHE